MSCRHCLVLLLVWSAVAASGTATHLQVEVADRAAPAADVELAVRWRNAWRNGTHHDGAWIVLRDPSRPAAAPLRLAPAGHRAEGALAAEITVSDDRLGAFIAPAGPHAGDVDWRVRLALAAPAAKSIRAFAVEMVFIPGGAFELGDDHPDARALGALYRCGEEAAPAGPYLVTTETTAIPIGPAPGQLYYDVGDTPQYRGDQQGPIPAAFPNGTRPFWIMKYELRQGQYAAFVAALPAERRARRLFTPQADIEDASTWSIQAADDHVSARAPDRACNFTTWDDTCAFLDWMALRPMTEMEFEKAARGPRRPAPLDFPWGTSEASAVQRRVLKNRDLACADATSEHALLADAAARVRLGASFFGVMDLSGGVWERVISIGHPHGRSFQGSHGDGVLDATTGDATNADWPRANADGTEADGIGYRGGAEYFAPEANLTNPFSPVGVRTYAAWNGAHRSKTYSARGVRTAPPALSQSAMAGPRAPLQLELLANAGVAVHASATDGSAVIVLFDAFVCEPYGEYGALDEAAFAALLALTPVPLAVASHVHADHLQVDPARRFLHAHPETLFASTDQAATAVLDAAATIQAPAADQVRALRPTSGGRDSVALPAVHVTAMRLTHSGPAAQTTENLGIIVDVAGWRIFHCGDADGLEWNFAPHKLAAERLDLALIPYWYLGSQAGRTAIREHIAARHVLAVHIPPGEEASVRALVAEHGLDVMVLDPGRRTVLDS